MMYQVMICFHFVLDTRLSVVYIFEQLLHIGLKKRHKYLTIYRR